MLKTHQRSLSAALTALALTACGDSESGLVGKTFRGEPLTTLRGTLSAEDATVIDGNVSIALLWGDANSVIDLTPLSQQKLPELTCTGEPPPDRSHQEIIFNGTGYFFAAGWIGQSVELASNFPLRFEVPIDVIPPQEAFQDLEEAGIGTGHYARASILVYIDKNGDGDFDAPSADMPADEVLALTPESVLYLDGTYIFEPDDGISYRLDLENDEPFALPQGFSLFSWEIDEEAETATPISRSTEDGVDIKIPVSIAERKEAERRVCTSVVLRNEYGGPLPADADPEDISCSEDNLSFDYTTARQMVPDRTCVLVRPYLRACIEEGATPPESWPCR